MSPIYFGGEEIQSLYVGSNPETPITNIRIDGETVAVTSNYGGLPPSNLNLLPEEDKQ